MEYSYTAGRNVKWFSHFGKQLAVPENVKHRVSIQPSDSILKLYQRELRTRIFLKTCMQIFIAALFRMAKKWK